MIVSDQTNTYGCNPIFKEIQIFNDLLLFLCHRLCKRQVINKGNIKIKLRTNLNTLIWLTLLNITGNS